MKLELNHLSPYLPYSLKCQIMGQDNIKEVFDIVGLSLNSAEVACLKTLTEQIDFEEVFPILRPMSDLIKKIKISDNEIVPLNFLNDNSMINYHIFTRQDGVIFLLADYLKGYNCLSPISAKDKLLEWNFDIFGLIEKGLAIDINTLK